MRHHEEGGFGGGQAALHHGVAAGAVHQVQTGADDGGDQVGHLRHDAASRTAGCTCN